jgi:uncharacterized protein YbbC (DUF1343 family)
VVDAPPPQESPAPPAFERVVLDSQAGIGYGVAVADVDGDGRSDVLLVDRHEVRWYQAPRWEPRKLCGRLTELDHVCVAARDVSGDARAEVAIGAGWNPADTVSSGATFLLGATASGGDATAPQPGSPAPPEGAVELAHEPTVHRMKWVRRRGGESSLVVLPLHGRGNANGEGEGVALLEHRPPGAGSEEWTTIRRPTQLHQTHNLDVVEWDGDEDEELLVAGREAIGLFDRAGEGEASSWTISPLVGAGRGPDGFRGASEVRLGRFANGRRFVATIEPFHGNELVAYLEPEREREPWARVLLDDSLGEGHAVACGDLFRRGDDAIVAGWRRPGRKGRTGIRIFLPERLEPPGFESIELDDRIACEDLALADLDADGRVDVVASGRDSHDVVLFLQRGAERGPPPAAALSWPRAPLDVHRLAAIEREIEAARARGELEAGCIVAVGRSDGLRFLRAVGERALVPAREPMALDTVFDLASLTKPIVTATSVAILAAEGRLALDDPLSKHLPGHESGATIRQCLLHTAGFVPDNDLSDYEGGAEEAWRHLLAQIPASEPGSAFVYSDVGYLLLGKVVERVSGRSLADFARERIFAPLSMGDTGFLPDEELRARAAPTEPRDGAMLRGVVHDPRAAKLGGVAGHAGLFSTVLDLSRFARALLRGGELDGARVLSEEALATLATPQVAPGGELRTPGFDARSRYSSNRGELFTARAFGHGGFTGAGLWIDPGLDLFVIFLSSRLHPDGKGLVNPRIGRIGTLAAAAVGRPASARARAAGEPDAEPRPPVRAGLDVLRDEGFERLRGLRVGLVTNHSGRARDGVSAIALLSGAAARAAGVSLAAIYTPEHGLDGLADAAVRDGVETTTGAPVFSLYGERSRPTAEMLRGLDALVFDVQDAGARCYTYVSTLKRCLEAAAEHGVARFVVLDRPDPIGGEIVEGPLPDSGRDSFTCPHPIPFRHGMTVGELARMFVAESGLGVKLEVVAMDGWRRGDLFDATGLPWVNPSPNLRSLEAELLYPGLVLFETTNLSVGRGTEIPFEQLGAPWLDAEALADDLAASAAPGARLAPVVFTPSSSRFAGERCRGLRITIADRAALRPMGLALQIAAALLRRHPKQWELEKLDALLCSRATIEALRAGVPPAGILARWREEAAAFADRRLPFLLYGGPEPR